jgi:hypothetical protein
MTSRTRSDYPPIAKPTIVLPRRGGLVEEEPEEALIDLSGDRTIGRFELIREIARGGMGQVFVGRDPKLGRKVAIKFLLRADERIIQRFLVEARATARCTHENIVTIYEAGEHRGLPYMVLEYLEGKTLDKVVEQGLLVRQFVELMVPVARALERAHEHGIVHRDLKPRNIFVTDRGQVKVLDFGVARVTEPTQHVIARVTAAFRHNATMQLSAALDEDSLVGTLPYMAPEQWLDASVDARADIWAFGIICWRALVGGHPVGGVEPERLRARLADRTPLPSIATRDRTLPRELVSIVDRCLAISAHERYQSATALLADLQAFLTPHAQRVSTTISPYLGLAPYTENDAQYFFGRTSEIRGALSQLDAWPVLAVVGPSGVGKSSFVHAGLVPALRAGGRNWQVRVVRPGRMPLYQLIAALDEHGTPGPHADTLLHGLIESPGLFGAMLRQAAAHRNERVLVIVDQLEELFTLCDNDDIRRLFLAAIAAAADDVASPVRLVLSMRADFLDRFAAYKDFLGDLSRGLFFLTAPDQANLREAIERPAEIAGFAFEHPSIDDDMIQVATARGALPLLSFAAQRLWESRDRERRLLTVAAYQQMGGVGGAFARHADQVASSLPLESRGVLGAVMTRLVTPEGTRAIVDQRDLLALSESQGDIERVLDVLVRGRLIHLRNDVHEGTMVELVHEMLITEWPAFKRWLDDSNAIRVFVHDLQQAAKQWSARNRSPDLVWRGEAAAEALQHAARHVLDLAPVEREYLAAVSDLARRRRRRVATISAAVITAIALVLAGSVFGFVRVSLAERDARDKAQQAASALQQSERDRELAVRAQGELQAKLDIIEAERKRREDAERNQALSRGQLAEAVEALERKVIETQAATARAQANEELAKKASEEAKAAKREVEQLLATKRRELEALKKRMNEISNRKL